MHHIQTARLEGSKVILVGKQSKLMPLGKVFNSFGRGDQIMEVHDRDAVCHFADVHTSNLEIRLIDEDGPNMTSLIQRRGQPGLNNHEPTWMQMALHRLQRLL